VDGENQPQNRKVLDVAPVCLTPDHILGLIESVYSVGGKIDSEELNNLIDVDMDLLTHAIDVAEALGLVVFDRGDITVTELGTKVAVAPPKEARKIVRDKLAALEPFTTLINEVKMRGGRISVSMVRKVLAGFYGEENVDSALNCLRQWWRYFELFSRRGGYIELSKSSQT